jgi:hypothetical protein
MVHPVVSRRRSIEDEHDASGDLADTARPETPK